jgi:hypothetical protein
VLLFRYVLQQLSEAQVLEIGATDPVRNVSITQFDRGKDKRWQLTRYNDVSHLEQTGAPITEHRGEVDVPPGR